MISVSRVAAHLRGHGLQLPAGQYRRPARFAAHPGSAARALQDRIFPRRGVAPRRQHAGRGRARAPVDRELRDQGQQGHQDRGSAEEPAQRRSGDGQRPTISRCSRRSSSTSPINTSAAASMQCASTPMSRSCRVTRVRVSVNIVEGKARQDPPDQHRRQYAVQGQGAADGFELNTPNVALVLSRQDDRYARESLQGDLGSCAPTTWIAA